MCLLIGKTIIGYQFAFPFDKNKLAKTGDRLTFTGMYRFWCMINLKNKENVLRPPPPPKNFLSLW